MLEAVDQGILAINNDGEVLLANDAAKQFCGVLGIMESLMACQSTVFGLSLSYKRR